MCQAHHKLSACAGVQDALGLICILSRIFFSARLLYFRFLCAAHRVRSHVAAEDTTLFRSQSHIMLSHWEVQQLRRLLKMCPLAWGTRLMGSSRPGICEVCHATLVLPPPDLQLVHSANDWASTSRSGLSLPDNAAVQSCTGGACQFARFPCHLFWALTATVTTDLQQNYAFRSCSVAHTGLLAKGFPSMFPLSQNAYNAAGLSSFNAAKQTMLMPSTLSQRGWAPSSCLSEKGK